MQMFAVKIAVNRLNYILKFLSKFGYTVQSRVIFNSPLTPAELFSSPEPKAHGELIVYQSSRRLSVCLCVCVCSHFQT